MKKLLTAIATLLAAHAACAGVKIENWVSPSGARVYFVESRSLPILDVQVDFAAGSMFDPPGKSGTATLTRAALDLGAGKLDETAVAEQMADIGATLGGSADSDRASVAVRTLAAREKRDAALDVLRTILHAPRFDAAIFEREKARTIAGLKEAMTRPDSIAGKAFWAAMYPDHPYGRQATPESFRQACTRFIFTENLVAEDEGRGLHAVAEGFGAGLDGFGEDEPTRRSARIDLRRERGLEQHLVVPGPRRTTHPAGRDRRRHRRRPGRPGRLTAR